jgi:phospholipase C
MSCRSAVSKTLHALRIGLAFIALFQFSLGASLVSAAPDHDHDGDRDHHHHGETRTPIKHVITIIGENRSFDHVYATYVPRDGESIHNLLSEGIINADGTPGPHFNKAEQKAATDMSPDAFLLSPPKTTFPNNVLPAPLAGGAFDSYIPNDSLTLAMQSENGLPTDYYPFLVSGGTGLTSKTPDTRITNVNSLPAGPFQLTNGTTFTYNAYAQSPVHRFYQMWQQEDCSVSHATDRNPSGCNHSLFSWVEVTVGAGTNGLAQSSNFSTEYAPKPTVTTGEGSTALGFYNVQQGDAPYMKHLADRYSMSDNFHQSVDGGTGANHIMLGHGDAIWFSDGNGTPLMPPHMQLTGSGVNAGVVDEVEDPDPATGTNNWYAEDGYGGGSFGSSSFGGGSYSNCSDPTQPGVAEIVAYLQSLPNPVDPRCEPGHYYLLNNYNPGWFGNGANAYIDPNPANTVFTIPPSSTPSIGDTLNSVNISWKYYGDQWNPYVPDPYQINYGAVGSPNGLGVTIQPGQADEYCNICNPFQYDTSIMGNPAQIAAHIQDTLNLYSDIQNGTLPAVSFVKPSGFVDGHPSSSKLNLFEGFVKKIVDMVEHSDYADDTAIFITFDEGGGYYDSGYVQPLDFFGDGTRIPLIAVSAYSRGGHVTHDYADHVSILKFIERNWNLPPVTSRSRDNFPNPQTDWRNSYVPTNGPAISDLFELFDFGGHGGSDHDRDHGRH